MQVLNIEKYLLGSMLKIFLHFMKQLNSIQMSNFHKSLNSLHN